MKRFGILLALAGLWALPAAAQTPAPAKPDAAIETVIVTGEKLPAEVVHSFVRSFAGAAENSDSGEITRWARPICVGTEGLSSEDLNYYVTQRIRQIAAEVGVKVEEPPCRWNIEVMFTSDPQGFLDRVKVEGADLLGPHPSQASTVAVMRHPIQAWYATGIADRNGNLVLDNDELGAFTGAGNGLSTLQEKPTMYVEGSLLRTGLQSQMAHIYIVADSNKTGDYKLGPIADYIAVMALSQSDSFAGCRPLPSISNLMSDCPVKPVSITDPDLAYLRGLYKMDPGANYTIQQSDIAGEMLKDGMSK